MGRNSGGITRILFAALAATALWGGMFALAATKSVDLDGNGTAESSCALNVLSTYPAKIENVVTNKSVGNAFTFSWFSAGPGGFSSSVGTGTSAGVGAKWTWQTSKSVYSYTGNSCTNDICFTATAGQPAGTRRGPFSVPGRSLVTSGVTLSNTSLTSSLIAFFSPPKVIFSATSSVGQPGSGQVAYSTTLSNTSNSDLTVHVEAGPPGCCPYENQLNCDGTCVDYLTDEYNCGGCGVTCDVFHGQFCDAGTCVSICPLGTTLCGTECVDTTTDPMNCGGCGNVCGTNQICTDSACFTCRPPEQTACDNRCVNLHTDAENCGACGVNCNFLCPSTGQGTCSQGNSCFCVGGTSATGVASFTAVSTLPPPAPVCETQATTQSIPAGGTASLGCNSSSYLAKEVLTFVNICLDGSTPNAITGLCADFTSPTVGPFIQLVPDMLHPVGSVAVSLSPVGVAVREGSGDGLMQPGEIANINIAVANTGFATLTGACATLSSPEQDITPDDGISNPTSVSITTATACYPDLPGVPAASGDCSSPTVATPVSSNAPFTFSIPADYLGDTSRVFILHFTGTANGLPVSEDVPVTLGIAGSCNALNPDGNYDGLKGLDSPMAALVPADDTRSLPFPPKPFSLGKTRPMKLNVSCGGANLNDTQVLAPKIVALFNLTTNQPVDITKININDSPNPYDPFFRFQSSSSGWIYNMRTRDLTVGKYRLSIQIGGRKDYVTGFELK